MTMQRKSNRTRTPQHGSTLIVAMLMLVVILMIGISAVISSDTQSKLTGNLQFEDVAFNLAEQALATGERIVVAQQSAPLPGFTTYSSTTPCYHPIGHMATLSPPNNDPLTMTWDNSNSCDDGNGGRYLIEKISARVLLNSSSHASGGHAGSPPVLVDTYQITTQGLAARGTSKYLQSYYAVIVP